MTTEEKYSLLLHLYEKKFFCEGDAFYFGGKTYREEVLSEYKKKIEKAFKPSERLLMTKGIDTFAAIAFVRNFEDVIVTGDENLDDYYKNGINPILFLTSRISEGDSPTMEQTYLQGVI